MAMPKFINLVIDTIFDKTIRDNFQRISDYINADPFKKGQFVFVSIPLQSGTTRFAHNLGYKPTDVITLSVSKNDSAAVTWKYDSFTSTHLVLISTGPCTVRAYVGSYKE